METRTVTQYKIYVLHLNDMRSSNIEMSEIALISFYKEDLKEYMRSKKVETYRDGRWGKTFEQGSVLEWFNSPHDIDSCNLEDSTWGTHGIGEEWVSEDSLESLPRRFNFLQDGVIVTEING